MSVRRLAVARAGAAASPSKEVSFPATPSQCITSEPPPMPEDCGSTRPSTIWAAIAASMGVPPLSSMARAARVARGCAVTAICE